MKSLRYSDLVIGPTGKGTPFMAGGCDPSRGLDCRGVSHIMLKRAGKDIPECALLGGEDVEGSLSMEWLESYLDAGIDRWNDAGDPLELGDLVLSEHNGSPHASVVVQLQPVKVITSLRGNGVLVMPLYTVTGVERILRWN